MLARNNEKGFSIVEVLLGVAIFMIGMLGIAALQISSIKGNSFSANLTESTYLLSNKVEDLMGRGYDHADLTDTNADGDGGLDEKDPAAADHSENAGRNNAFTVYWNVAEDKPVLHCKTIQVYVRWSIKGNPQAPIGMQYIKEKSK